MCYSVEKSQVPGLIFSPCDVFVITSSYFYSTLSEWIYIPFNAGVGQADEMATQAYVGGKGEEVDRATNTPDDTKVGSIWQPAG